MTLISSFPFMLIHCFYFGISYFRYWHFCAQKENALPSDYLHMGWLSAVVLIKSVSHTQTNKHTHIDINRSIFPLLSPHYSRESCTFALFFPLLRNNFASYFDTVFLMKMNSLGILTKTLITFLFLGSFVISLQLLCN